jgi:hypothetical protein
MEGTRTIGALERLILAVTHPGAAFSGLQHDRFAWILPLIVLTVLTWLPSQVPTIRSLQIDRQQAQMERLLDSGLLSEDQSGEIVEKLDGLREIGLGQRALRFGLGSVSLLLFRIMLPAILLLVGVRFVMEGRAGFAALMNAVTFAAIPAGIREIIRLPLQLAKGSLDVYFSPAVLTGTDSVGGYALNQLDLFDLWVLALLIPAVATVGGISPRRAAGLVLPLWAVHTLLKIGYKATPFGIGA